MTKDYLSANHAILLIRILGVIQLLIGFFALFIAPVEIYCFYLFSKGGVFYYDGFGIGSVIHGLIIAQIFAFYAIGILFILIGYGHIKLKSWTLNLSISSIWFWIIFGLPVMIFFLPLLTMKEINIQYPFFFLSLSAIILIIVIPGLLLFFYHQTNVKKLFTSKQNQGSEPRILPVKSYLALLVYCLYILIFHIMIFYQGLIPVFGKFLTGLSGITIYGFLILLMILLIYGLIKKLRIVWITSIIFFGLFTISTIITFLNYKYINIIELLNLPKPEHDIFMKFPLTSFYLLLPATIILIISLIIIFRTRGYNDKKIYGI